MKKLLFLFVFVTSIAQAQHTIKGTMTPPEKSDWVMLQKLQGTKPKFILHTTIKVDTVDVGGNKQAIGRFEFTMPKDMQPGMYRATYRERGAGFIDFLYNGEDVEMVFNPTYPDESVMFIKSEENKLYREYQDALALTQRSVDSIQVSYLDTGSKDAKKAYKDAVKKTNEIQKLYESKSKGMLANHFVKASKNTNPETAKENTQDYLNSVVDNFFKNVNFKSKELYNSSFLINKIVDYVFYLNTADSQQLQQKMYKESIPTVLQLMVDDKKQTKEVVEFLITTFTDNRNSEIVDWLFDTYYNVLPANLQDANFKKNKLEALRVSVGRTAPDFSWKEDGKNYKLSTLNDGENYLLIFWSTRCSHCRKEIPEVHEFMKSHKETSVIAFAIEDDDLDFNSWVKNKLYDWHNVIGTHPDGRFENQTVKDYLIAETPTYFILDKNKKIIANPDALKDIKDYFNSLKK